MILTAVHPVTVVADKVELGATNSNAITHVSRKGFYALQQETVRLLATE
jgi:hypothetical protein